MADLVITNWFGDIVSHPKVVVDAHSVDDIIAVLKDSARYPSPVRAVGSNHSTTACGTADGGTLLKMKMNRILEIGTDTLRVEAGATHLEMAKALEQKKLQFYVNTEIGSLSAGSAACAGTKDGSMPGEYGQVGSYVLAVKMVLPNGELLEVTEATQPELMQKIRASYGTFGIIYEVTFRVRPLTPLAVYHETFRIEDFVRRLPELKARNQSMMFFIFVPSRKITVEFRSDNPAASGDPQRFGWRLRNYLWAVFGPRAVREIQRFVPVRALRYGIFSIFQAGCRVLLQAMVKGENTIPADQIIDYPPVANQSRYTFSLFAFPEEQYPKVLTEFCDFCEAYEKKTGYRPNLIDVGYAIAQDRKSLLSYSFNGPVMTIDPVSTAEPGWWEFLEAYNQFCSDHNGAPLMNQTFGVTPAMVRKAYGERLRIIEDTRKAYDPNGRLLNEYFRKVLGAEGAAASPAA